MLTKTPLILVVDDDPFIRKMLCRYLGREQYRVSEACNSTDALTLYHQHHPDLVLLDAILPGGIDGFELCLQLQALPESDRAPVLMITGLEDQASVDHAFEVGAIDYVTKPIHWAVLRQRVRRLLRQTQLQRELLSANVDLRRLANMDGLTQIANRRSFDDYLQQEWQRAIREQTPLSVLLCDIDFFKQYNDRYGHPAGDVCLQQVAQVMQQAGHRATDLAARYGGEEFVVLLPNTTAIGAAQIAERLLTAVRELQIPHAASTVSPVVTVSCGVASVLPSPQSNPAYLVEVADQALYQAKTTGRDRIRLIHLNRTEAGGSKGTAS